VIKILKKTALISCLTFSSRILGVIRDMVIAMFFGTSVLSDAFFIAFRPFDLIRKLFSEGILGVSFIPVFSDTLEKQGKSAATGMLYSFFCLLSAGAVIVMITGLFGAPFIMTLIAPGFEALSYEYNLTMVLFKIMLPYFWLIVMAGLSMSVLNALGNFGAPALAPVVFNIGMILFIFLAIPCFPEPVTALSVGVTIGGLLQLAVQIPFMVRTGILKPVRFRLFAPQSLKLLKIMVPAMIGAASYQINIMTASFFASTLDEGSVSYLYYADRLVQFPLALFAVSVATVFLPDLSKKMATGKICDMGIPFSNAVMMVLFITIPAMAGLMALNKPIVAVLFGHGAFKSLAVDQTARCLFFLVTGLWAYTASRLFVTLYYGMSKIYLPFFSGLIAVGLNIVLSFVFIKYWGLTGLALSVSISAMAGCIFLFIHIPAGVNIARVRIILSACRSVFFAVIMFACVRLAADYIPVDGSSKAMVGAGLAASICLGVTCYLGLNFWVSTPEIKMFLKGFKKN